jgi:hypothetical protein
MYKTQRGCFPIFISTIGSIFFVGLIGGLLISNIESWFSARTIISVNGTIKFIFSHLTIDLIILMIFLPWPLFFAGMFPMVRITRQGVKYRYLGLFGGLIRFDEIEEIADLKRPPDYKVIIISRKGFYLFKGLWMSRMYGLAFTGQNISVLVLSPGICGRDEFLDEIQQNISGLRRRVHNKKHSYFVWFTKFRRAKTQ